MHVAKIIRPLLVLVLSWTAQAWGAEIHWKNGVSGNWNVGTNWVGDAVPGSSDTAVIDVAGTYTVTLDINATVAGFTLNNADATFSGNGRLFTVNGTGLISSGAVLWAGSTWTGTGTLTNNGTMTFSSGCTIACLFAQQGMVFIGTTGGATLTSALGFTNSGTITLDTTSGLATTLAVTSGDLINDVTGVIGLGAGGIGARQIFAEVENNGSINVMTSQGVLRLAGATHVNNGLIAIAGSGAKLFLDEGARLTNNGNVTIAAGGTLELSESGTIFENSPGAQVDNAGTFQLLGGTTLEVKGGTFTGSSAPLIAGSATLRFGAGASATGAIAVTGSGNTLQGDVPFGVELRIGTTGGATLTSASGFTNSGTITLNSPSGGLTLVVTSGTLINDVSGVISLGSGSGALRTLAAALENRGSLNILGTSGALNKTGVTHLNSGLIAIAGSGAKLAQDEGARLTNNGDITIAGGGTLELSESGTIFENSPGAQVDNAGTFQLLGGTTLEVNGGTFTGVSAPLIAGSATLRFGPGASATGVIAVTGSGNTLQGDVPFGMELRIGTTGGATLTSASGFTNSGTITLNSPSGGLTLVVTSGTLINDVSGVISLGSGSGALRTLAAALENRGSLNILGTSGALNKTGAAHRNFDTASIVLLSGNTLTVTGASLHQDNGGFVGGGALVMNGATLYGDGFIEANVTLTGGASLSPGPPPAENTGILEIDGTLTLQGNHSILSAIAGSSPGTDYDQLNVSGLATLNGRLDILYPSLAAPCQGESYTVLTYASHSNSFSGGITGLTGAPNGFTLSSNVGATSTVLTTVVEPDCNGNCQDDVLDITTGFSADCDWTGSGPNVIPDECDIADCASGPACGDCNTNAVPDGCDLADCTGDPACGDCDWDGNGPNGILDGCDIAACAGDPACGDCNTNSTPDGCERAACAVGEFACQDCNGNGMLDECDIAGGAVDLDANGVPDVCYPAAAPEPGDKTRFISFSIPAPPPTLEVLTALRVVLASLHHVDPPYTGGASVPFTSFEGQVRWVGPPTQYIESNANPTPFYASVLQCAPHYQDWSTVGLLHVTGSAIVPSSVYEVENVAASCAGVEASCTAVSNPLEIGTTRWGDVEIPYNPPSTTVQPDLADIGALVNKFRSASGAPIKARALINGDDAFGNISTLGIDLGFGHISACVDAFRGKPYPFTIQSCP